MAYHSLFDTVIAEDPTFSGDFNGLGYEGTLDRVLTETERMLDSGDRTSNAVGLALHPPRIIRAFIDYKIQHPSKDDVELLLREAIQLGLDIYKGEGVAVEELKELKKRAKKSGNGEVLQRALKQPLDSVTWKATHPSRSKRTAGDLVTRANSGDVLFVALAHGGVAAGMDAYLRYCDQVGSDDSEFYVARFSTQKLGDLAPKLSPTEIAYLHELATERQPVIFDEDRFSGKTLSSAEQFFGSAVFPFRNLVVLTNLDARTELAYLGFGKELLEMDKSLLGDKDKNKSIGKLYLEVVIKDKTYNSLEILTDKIDYGNNYILDTC